MLSVLFFVGTIAAAFVMLWLAFRMEPHWVSKDGERFAAYGQALTNHGLPIGRWREMRVMKMGDRLEVRPRRGSLRVENTSMPSPSKLFTNKLTKATLWKVAGRSQAAQGRKVVYMLDGC